MSFYRVRFRHSIFLLFFVLLLPLSLSYSSDIDTSSISVDSYGAKPDGSTDSTQAFKEAINAVKLSGGLLKRITMSEGTYFLKCPPPSWVTPVNSLPWPIIGVSKPQPQVQCLNVEGINQLSIEGMGISKTHLVIGNPVAGLVSVKSSNGIALRSFSVDYKPLPFTQGKIIKINKDSNYLEVDVLPGYPKLDTVIFSNKYFPDSFGMVMEASRPRLKQTTKGFFFILDLFKNINGTFKVSLDPKDSWAIPGISLGDLLVLPVRVSDVFSFYQSSNLTLKDVAVYSGPGAASIWEQNSGKIVVDGFQVRRKPETDRWISTAADALHMADNSAKILIQNSYIEGMGDDAINIYCTLPAISLVSGSRFTINKNSNLFNLWQHVQIVDSDTFQTKGEGRIVSLTGSSETLEFSLDHDLPMAVNDKVFIIELAAPGAMIFKNTFGSFRGFFRVRSAGAVMRNNKILDSVNAKVLVDSDPKYNEGPSLLYNEKNMVTLSQNSVDGNGSLTLVDRNNKSVGSRSVFLNSLLFDPVVYRGLNPDLARYYSDVDITTHWLDHGIAEGRQGSLTFNSREYLGLYPDLVTAFGATGYKKAAEHFLFSGNMIENRTGTIRTNSLIFEPYIYRSLNSDLDNMNDSQITNHWLNYGISEGRQASFGFKSSDYLALNPDLSNASYSYALTHYVTHGFNENRVGSIKTDPLVYSPLDYKKYNSDLGVCYNDLTRHWIRYGINEGRRASENFSSRAYLDRYSDLGGTASKNYLYAITHYVLYGFREGRVGK